MGTFKYIIRKNLVWFIVTVVMLALVLTASLVATQNEFIYGTFSTVFGGERRVLVSGDDTLYQYYIANEADQFKQFKSNSDFSTKAKALDEANKLNEQMAEEGFVLLKNEGKALPVATPNSPSPSASKPKISIFGKNSVNLVYGGSGSATNAGGKDVISIFDAVEKAGFEYNPSLKKFYEGNKSGGGRSPNPDMGKTTQGLLTGETPQGSYTDEIKSSYTTYKDMALVVISRIGGEGFDLPRTMLKGYGGAVLDGSNEGDHYLELDNNEKALLSEVSNKFEKVVLIVNSATPMELGFLDDGTYDSNGKIGIDAALWIASPGGSGINALGSILNGSINPSGRLVDAYARDFKADPTWNNIGDNRMVDGNRYNIGTAKQNAYFVDYEEGVYIGYRYWETRAYMEEYDRGDTTWYAKNVVYPFGYGLSYTNFTWAIEGTPNPADTSTLTADDKISVDIKVTNEGEVAGKDVVQLYYRAPYYAGEIEKPHVVLGAFAKTKLLGPGESDIVKLELDVSDMAVYDYNDANRNGFKGYELDTGNYHIYISTDSHASWNSSDAFHLRYAISDPIEYRADPKTGEDVVNRFDDVSEHIETYMSRDNFGKTFPTMATNDDRNVSVEFINSLKYDQEAYDAKYGANYIPVEMPTQGWKPDESKNEIGHKMYELLNYTKDADGKAVAGTMSADYNDVRWKNLLDQVTVSEMIYMIGTANFNTKRIDSIGKPLTTEPDGPAGFTAFMGDPSVYGTCFYASECTIAATFNTDLAYDMGIMIGIEGIIGNEKGDGRTYSGWYAPAVNTHRSPFSGRNWEYYSEDPLLSGKMGAHVVMGAKEKGIYTFVKHFAVNDQETNRDTNGLITWLSEQSLREIYLKPFEIIVKEGGTTGMMSSFNRIGTVWAGGSYELMTEVLRKEWGFVGMVISDYNLCDHMPPDQMIRAGGDINLSQSYPPTNSPNDKTQVAVLRQATMNVLYTVANSNAMNGMGEGVVYKYVQPMWVTILIVVDVAIVAALAIWGFFSIFFSLKKRKRENA